MKKVCIITCYFDPDYVRARTLRASLSANEDIDLIIVKNRRLGLLRYPEIIFKIISTRIRLNPDIYLLTFRGQEILPFLLLLVWPKKVIFDEFIVPLAWAKQEGHSKTLRNRLFKAMASLSAPLYKIWLKQCCLILTDTKAHAQESSNLSDVPLKKYYTIPVGADENLFKPEKSLKKQKSTFEVFFYGSKMTPLHGLKYILEAAQIVNKNHSNVKFVISGGDDNTAKSVKEIQESGTNIIYKKWISFEELPQAIAKANICLGGPFGDTPQAKRVITGKTYQFLACGAPTIIGDNEAANELTAGIDCLKVEQANATDLADKIIWAYKNPKKLEEIGRNGRQIYEKLFSNEVITKNLKKVITNLL